MKSVKLKGLQFPSGHKRGEGIRERIDRYNLSSSPPNKFKISHKALVSSSNHGIMSLFLLLNSRVATLT